MTTCRQPDPFGDPRLVQLYDQDNPGGADHDFFRSLADDLGARTIIDLGCGTGLLTVTLATDDRTVIGIDPSAAMLDYACRRPGAGAVTWIQGDAAAIVPALAARRADLVLMTGNVAQHITGDAWPTTLRHVHECLRVGGVVAFESRNPEDRACQTWTEEATRATRDTESGRLTEWLEVTSVADGEVTFRAHNLFEETGEDAIFETTLAFRTLDELTEQLTTAGLAIRSIGGGWAGEPAAPDSPIYVVVAWRR